MLMLDPDSKQSLKKLNGKQLKLCIREFPWPLTFSFSDRVDVMGEELGMDGDSASTQVCDCYIELNLETLPELQDSSKISQLIQRQKLVLEGDIQIAQEFSSLIKELNIDWEEQLSKYTGDVVAHQTFSSMKAVFDSAQQNFEKFGTDLTNLMMKENAIGVPASELENYYEQISELRSASDRLDARLSIIERQKQDLN